MRIRHLNGKELDRLLAGEALPDSLSEHVQSCVACRRRRDTFLSAVAAARLPEPDATRLEEVREEALDRWSGGSQPRRWSWRWFAAAAAVVVLAVVSTFLFVAPAADEFNPEAVLAEVDEVLARDPLTLVAPEELLEVVLTEGELAEPANPS